MEEEEMTPLEQVNNITLIKLFNSNNILDDSIDISEIPLNFTKKIKPYTNKELNIISILVSFGNSNVFYNKILLFLAIYDFLFENYQILLDYPLFYEVVLKKINEIIDRLEKDPSKLKKINLSYNPFKIWQKKLLERDFRFPT